MNATGVMHLNADARSMEDYAVSDRPPFYAPNRPPRPHPASRFITPSTLLLTAFTAVASSRSPLERSNPKSNKLCLEALQSTTNRP
jgi:hypothetical protein